MFELDGKTALVTGATRGIGEASARALDSAGARVILSGRTTNDLIRVASELKNEPVILEADLSPRGAGSRHAEQVLEATQGEGVNIIVNNAGIPMRRSPEALSEEDFDLVFSINVRSLLMLSIGLAEPMKRRGEGSIVNISSVASLRGPLGRVAYAGTKGAVDAMTRVSALELGKYNIRVNAVNPTVVMTPMSEWYWGREDIGGPLLEAMPLHRWATEEDCAAPIVFLLSDASAMISGVCLPIDGGFTAV